MLPSVPIFPVYIFFRQNIWHLIFDQFHFHHIFGDEMTVSSGKGTTSRNILGTSWVVIWEKNFKYLKAQHCNEWGYQGEDKNQLEAIQMHLFEYGRTSLLHFTWNHMKISKKKKANSQAKNIFPKLCNLYELLVQ